MSVTPTGKGERPDDREVYRGLVKDCVESGLSREKAERMSRDAMAKAEREAERLGRR